tara:strand:+ start:5573 stop:6259 length:687 start_codon:yes stop_codon:yes gene_type:complete
MLTDQIRSKLHQIQGAINDSRASTELSRLGLAFRPWPGSAVRPAALQMLLNEIFINGRRSIVEFGSGISTLYLAKALDNIGDGHLVSFESDEQWAAIVRSWLKEEGVEARVTLVLAPMADCSLALNGLEWYDLGTVTKAMEGFSPDCVFVDGPLAYQRENKLSRYPAVPALQSYLADEFVVVLDDASREGERQVASKWASLLGVDFVKFPIHGNVARATKGKAFETCP